MAGSASVSLRFVLVIVEAVFLVFGVCRPIPPCSAASLAVLGDVPVSDHLWTHTELIGACQGRDFNSAPFPFYLDLCYH